MQTVKPAAVLKIQEEYTTAVSVIKGASATVARVLKTPVKTYFRAPQELNPTKQFYTKYNQESWTAAFWNRPAAGNREITQPNQDPDNTPKPV